MKHSIRKTVVCLSLGTATVFAHAATSQMDMPGMGPMPGMSKPNASARAGHEFVFGEPGNPVHVDRTVHIEALDSMRFRPARITVRPGETVRFVVTNVGKLHHEFVIGDVAEQEAHEKEMQAMKPGEAMSDHDPNGIDLPPGSTRTIVWKFAKAGKVEFACHMPGHFRSGMVGVIHVRSVASAQR